MISKIKKYIEQHSLIHPSAPVLLACSGGRDSMFALDFLIKSGYKTGVAHCNFNLRGEESDKEQEFVKAYCSKNGIPFYTTKFDTSGFAKQNKISTQMAARELRYNWLEEIRKTNGYHQLVTAHHLNDQAETILLNLINGTGMEGLKGISAKNGFLVRPFLQISRKEIDDYIEKNKIPYCDDSSNESLKYDRNFIRHSIVQPLSERFSKFPESLDDLTDTLQEQVFLYREKISEYKKKMVVKDLHFDTIKWDLIQKHPAGRTLLYEILKDYGFSSAHAKDVFDNLKTSVTGSQYPSESHVIIKDRNLLYVQPKESEIVKMASFSRIPNQIVFNNYKIKVSILPIQELNMKTSANYAYLDLDKIKFPLTIRYWRDGDYFYPYGLTKPNSEMPGKKKVSKYFKDLKISVAEKDFIPLLFSGEYLVWMVGHRIDHRFAVTEKTKEVLKLKILDNRKD